MPDREINYRGATLKVDIANNAASLIINGLERDGSPLDDGPTTLRLSSTVQTDYEWHEFIEGVLEVSPAQVQVTLRANNRVLKTWTVDRS